MKITTTAILGATAIVLGVVIAAVDQNAEIGAGSAEEASVLVRFDESLVDRMHGESTSSRGSAGTST